MKWFRKRVKPRNPANYYEPCSRWGNSIVVKFGKAPAGKTAKTARVTGWQFVRPVDGDVYLMPMQSGRTTVWAFHNVEHVSDPDDMFFADLTFIGYEDMLEMPARARV